MIKQTLTLVGLLVATVALNAAELEWMTDFAKAKEKARAEKKLVLMNFTGSDWCGFCIKQEKESFATPEFRTYARQNLVLLMLDFPRKKEISTEQREANTKLRDQFKVRGFPTLVILDPDGKEADRQVGYGGGGPKPLIAKLDKAKGR